MLSSPGDASSVRLDSFFLIRTMGLLGDSRSLSSNSVGSPYFLRDSRSLAIMANGFSFLPYHSLIFPSLSRVQHICIPPQPLTTAILPLSSSFASVCIGFLTSNMPLPSSNLYLGPHFGQHIVWWWNLLSFGSLNSLRQSGHRGNASMEVSGRS